MGKQVVVGFEEQRIRVMQCFEEENGC